MQLRPEPCAASRLHRRWRRRKGFITIGQALSDGGSSTRTARLRQPRLRSRQRRRSRPGATGRRHHLGGPCDVRVPGPRDPHNAPQPEEKRTRTHGPKVTDAPPAARGRLPGLQRHRRPAAGMGAHPAHVRSVSRHLASTMRRQRPRRSEALAQPRTSPRSMPSHGAGATRRCCVGRRSAAPCRRRQCSGAPW